MADGQLPRPRPRRRWARLGLLALLIAGIAAFYLAGLDRYFDWDALKARVDSLKGWVDDNFLTAAVAFGLIYVAVTALSLPVATGLTLVGGALFGRWVGVGVVSAGATVGATLAMLSSRFLFRDAVERRFGHRLRPIHEGIARDGAYYLLTIRLVPIFPYFLVNLAMGLTRIRTWTYFWITWLGMLPVTVVYVNVGTEIGKIQKPSDAVSPRVLFALAMLGVVPLVLRLLLPRRKRP